MIVRSEERRKDLKKNTRHNIIVERASASIAVFVESSVMYNDVKDHQSMGVCIQNMLLALIPFAWGRRVARRNPRERLCGAAITSASQKRGTHGCHLHRSSCIG